MTIRDTEGSWQTFSKDIVVYLDSAKPETSTSSGYGYRRGQTNPVYTDVAKTFLDNYLNSITLDDAQIEAVYG